MALVNLEQSSIIEIHESKTADSRTSEIEATREQLWDSTYQHIGDVGKGLEFFREMLKETGQKHDYTKLRDIDEFFECYAIQREGRKEWDFKRDCPWYTKHVTEERHHLHDHVPDDVTLIDVMERICDIVMAGMGRSGDFTGDELSADILMKAYENTWKLLKKNVRVVPSAE